MIQTTRNIQSRDIKKELDSVCEDLLFFDTVDFFKRHPIHKNLNCDLLCLLKYNKKM